MEPIFVTHARRPPSERFKAFAADYGHVVTRYGPLDELVLYPALIAARGRARSFSAYRNGRGDLFNEAECHYVTGDSPDAFAARRDGAFCIAVFVPVAWHMLDIMSLAFACPKFFPEIGDPSKEDGARVTARSRPAGYGFFRKDEFEEIRVKSELAHPLCPIREQAALYFTGLALDGIWTHELAHAFMGHLDYADAHLGVRALGETPQSGNHLRQMPLEAEADRFAAATLVQSAFGGSPYLPRALSGLNQLSRVKAGFVAAAITTWFWAFQQRIEREFDGFDPYAQGTHPPPLTRLHLSFDGAREMLVNLGWPMADIQMATFGAMSELESLATSKDWFSILDPKRSFDRDALNFSKDVKTVLGDTFRAIHDDLEPLRYTAPPTS